MKTYFRILTYVKPFWKHLTISVLCTILYALLNGASIYLTIPLLDTLFQQKQNVEINDEQKVGLNETDILPESITEDLSSVKKSFNDFVFDGSISEVLIRICLLILFAFMGKNLFGYLQSYFLAFAEQGVIRDIRNDAYAHLHRLPMAYFKNEKTGNLISRITNDATILQNSISAVFLNLVREPLSITVFLAIAISISFELTLFSIVVLPFSLGIISWIGLKLRKQSAILQRKMADITTVLHETISGVKIVKAFGMEKYENEKFNNETNNFFKIVLKMVRVRNAASPLTEFLSIVVGVAIIYYGGLLVLETNELKASEFLGFLFAIFQLMPPIKELSSVNNRIQESSAAADRIFEIIDLEPDIKDILNPIRVSEFKEKIEFKGTSFFYENSSQMILDNINFTVKKGEIIALVGSSGAGKTTLVDLLPRFYDPTSGGILIDGIDIKNIKLSNLRRMMGIVTQETVLFNESIRDNIAYGLSEYPMEKIIEAAKSANAHRFIVKLSKKYDTIIGEKGTKLSGGQRQRISIARALLKNPPIMIFDEATSALDNESEVLVQEAIERLMEDRTTFVIAHRLSTIRNASRIIVLDKGKIVQVGNHEELLADENGIYKKLYELQYRD
ncbi:MAG: ATP-binding cassette domain-containing protein [Melioribacteraceae bacterium]|nr:ATP-binding cassette domain-containing protein [Melioribacteraceae bacterium]